MPNACPKVELQACRPRAEGEHMKDIAHRIRPRGVRIHASAEFTSDMADNLASIFKRNEQDERVVVNFSNMGIWAVTGHGVRVFIGATDIFDTDEYDATKSKVQ